MMRVQLFLSVLLFCILYVSSQQFTVDLSQSTTPFAHYWEECVGSGHALLGMRADWQRHLTQAHADIGFKQVRFHGLFDDDMSAVLFNNGEITYSFFNIDTVFDFLVSIGMRPYVELSFMPEVFASGTATVMHYKGLTSPPKNYTQWEDFISSFAEHIIDRYGWDEISQWSFEVWNEPNCGFFNGTQDEYYTLFQHTSYAMKRVNSGLRVGGPVTCQSAYLTDFMNFCKANNVAYDFVATHEYPTDYNPSNRDILYEIFSKSRSEVGDDVKLYYSEFNDGLYANPAYHDTPYASAFLFHILHKVQGIVDLLSWWTFTDIFEEQGQISQPYYGVNGWGLLNMYQVPKPSYRAFQILHQLGTAQVPVTSTSSNSTTNVYAVLSQDGLSLDIIAYNFDLPDSAIQNETVTIVLSNLKNLPSISTVYRIDDTHANAPATWIAQGSPDYPTVSQIQQQLEASELVAETLQPEKISATSVQFTLELPKWGSAFLSISLV